MKKTINEEIDDILTETIYSSPDNWAKKASSEIEITKFVESKVRELAKRIMEHNNFDQIIISIDELDFMVNETIK